MVALVNRGAAIVLVGMLLGASIVQASDSALTASRADTAPSIDGIADDLAWQGLPWHPVKYRWLGDAFTAEDFNGQFRVTWTPERIFVLFELVDDVLIDTHRDPTILYWDDDALEVFIDEDASGGEHQFSFNAFAYHVALDNRAVDIGPDKKAHVFDHVESTWKQYPGKVVWEAAFEVYSDGYRMEADDNQPVTLTSGKKLGFMLAYCDNDGSPERENFIGSKPMQGPDKNLGFINADVFGTLQLVD